VVWELTILACLCSLLSDLNLSSLKNSSWLGSFIGTVIGNIKLSIGNIHIRYEDIERYLNFCSVNVSFRVHIRIPCIFFCSNPGHPFAAGLVLSKLSAVTVDDHGKETFATGGDLERVKKVYSPKFTTFLLRRNLI
jgi:vacuolar protein sorting-associated protein 13A/C